MFTNSSEGPGNEQSWVTYLLMYRSPFSFIENCSATPWGTTPEFLMLCRDSIVRGNAHPWSIYLLMTLFSAAALSIDWDYLWFPLSIIASKSDFLVSSSIGLIW